MNGKNQRGPVASTYEELQALPTLRDARQRWPLPPGGPASTLRAILQSAEVALWNLVDLLSRATADLDRPDVGAAVVKWGWAYGFHEVLSGLATTWQTLAIPVDPAGPLTRLGITQSPALGALVEVTSKLDIDALNVAEVIERSSLDDPGCRLLHLILLSSHESRQWEPGLSDLPVPIAGATYDGFVMPALIKDAVFETELAGDTCFLQFRGLHQVNEILIEEINQRLGAATAAVGARAPLAALDELRIGNLLFAAARRALRPMAEQLATSDYHQIRENLGLTSGAHSMAIHYRLFGESYDRLAAAVTDVVPVGHRPDTTEAEPGWQLVVASVLELRAGIDRWRQLHLHLPRNNLGAGETRSLIGSLDALVAVHKLREAARSCDPLRALAQSRGESARSGEPGPLSRCLDDPASVEGRILSATGQATRRQFTEVQDRTGLFATPAIFRPPPLQQTEAKTVSPIENGGAPDT